MHVSFQDMQLCKLIFMGHEHYNWCIRSNDENAYSFLLGTTFSYTSATFNPSCWLCIVHPNWDEWYNKMLGKKTPSNSFWLPPIKLKKRTLTLGSRTHRHRQCCLPMAKQFQPDEKHSRKALKAQQWHNFYVPWCEAKRQMGHCDHN